MSICLRCNGKKEIQIKDSSYVGGVHYERCGCAYTAEEMGVQEKFISANIKSFEGNTKLSLWVSAYIEKFNLKDTQKGIYFYSNTGTGKTYLSSCIMTSLAKTKGIRCYFTTVTDLLLLARRADNGDEELQEQLEKIKSIELLILDDLGVEKITDWTETFLQSLVDHRYSRCLSIIYTSNNTLQQLPNRFQGESVGSRLVSRIIHSCFVIEPSAGDYRLKHYKDAGDLLKEE
jgi:DNA replication protein DnaC